MVNLIHFQSISLSLLYINMKQNCEEMEHEKQQAYQKPPSIIQVNTLGLHSGHVLQVVETVIFEL